MVKSVGIYVLTGWLPTARATVAMTAPGMSGGRTFVGGPSNEVPSEQMRSASHLSSETPPVEVSSGLSMVNDGIGGSPGSAFRKPTVESMGASGIDTPLLAAKKDQSWGSSELSLGDSSSGNSNSPGRYARYPDATATDLTMSKQDGTRHSSS